MLDLLQDDCKESKDSNLFKIMLFFLNMLNHTMFKIYFGSVSESLLHCGRPCARTFKLFLSLNQILINRTLKTDEKEKKKDISVTFKLPNQV